MIKTTVYLSETLKRAVAQQARRSGWSEAEVIRQAVAAAVITPRPAAGFLDAEPFADQAEALLVGFGDR